ncbi:MULTISPECIES: recombinase family protein [Vagococcus]|uniref:recombinase family protein n=1 Tax=Vagococcus TaxID=2737 RepID=UPI000E54F6BB|nr:MULTISPECIES: recombinase family protein [Vagococcus]RHH70125.1 recombinase family protein [Vagococcus sp. AM17-17]
MKTAIYVRVSTNEQAEEGYSIDEQIDKLKKFCEVKDWQVANIYKDPGFTGSNIDRPGLKKLINDVENKKIETVLVYKLDRLSRSQKDTLFLIEDVFGINNTNFVSLNENFDTSTPFGKAMIGILAVFAQLEREQIKERMTMGKIGRAKAGKAMSWHWAPFGYTHKDDSYEVVDLEAQIVKQIFHDYLSGISITKLRDKMNDEGHIGKDIAWSYRTIRQTLDNPTYAGYTKYKDQIFPGNHEAIVSKEVYDEVQKQLEIRQKEAYKKNNNPRPFQAKYLVSGLVRCGHCGAALGLHQYAKKKDGTRTKIYKCHSRTGKKKNVTMVKADNCPSCDYPKEELENVVLSEIEKIRINPQLIQKSSHSAQEIDDTPLIKRLEELDRKLEKLVSLYLDETLSLEMLNDKKELIQKEKTAIEGKLNKTNKQKPELKISEAADILKNLKGSILKLDYEKQKIIVRKLIKQITLKDDEMVIQWRFAV